ncbi:MAG: thiamine diphosphokinase [Oscillospiraceae bacterium]
MNLENTCYIVGAASLDGVRLSPCAGDYVIAADGGYRSLQDRGIEPDFVMGDFDSLGYRPDHPNVETHPVMKDDTDLGLAVRWALGHGYRRLVMAGALGGRIDQTIASLQTLRGLTDAGAQGWLIGCGWVVTAVQNGTLTFPAGMEGTVSVFSSGDAARGVTLRGLLYEVTDADAHLRHAARREQLLHRCGGRRCASRTARSMSSGRATRCRTGWRSAMERIDLHTHTLASDGSDAPADVVRKAAALGLRAVAVTDHDTFAGLPEARAAGRRCGIEVVPGVELSTVWGGEEVHLLGYFMDTEDTALRTLMTRATDERNARNETMVQRLHDAGYPITMDDLHAAFPGQTVLGRPHIAALLVQRGCIASVPDGMRGLLGRGKEFYVPRYNVPLEDFIRALRAAGGVPVVAHIFKYRFDDAQRTAMLAAAADAGALGVEVRYTTYTPEQTAAAQALAERFGLAPSGGSDYHGLRKPDIALGSGRGGLRVPYAWLAGLKALAGPGRV